MLNYKLKYIICLIIATSFLFAIFLHKLVGLNTYWGFVNPWPKQILVEVNSGFRFTLGLN